MTVELSHALLVISLISVSCMVLSPIFWWILPDRSHSV